MAHVPHFMHRGYAPIRSKALALNSLGKCGGEARAMNKLYAKKSSMNSVALLLSLVCLCVGASTGVEYAARIQQGQCPSSQERQGLRDQISAEVQQVLSVLTNTCGGPGWRRAAFLDMSDPSQECPPGLNLTSLPIRTCGSSHTAENECSSTFFPTSGQYRQVCGRIRGYQLGRVTGFTMRNEINQGIDDAYVNGVSLTHLNRISRQHIWTFANGYAEQNTFGFPVYLCSCDGGPTPPSYVGQNYFCEAGSTDGLSTGFYSDDPLWDGEGCGPTSTCCELNNPPVFNTTLPAPTTEDIELRICHTAPTSGQDFPIEQIELYIK